jgi:serine/threonine protein kinase
MIHRDIKPENFLVGLGMKSKYIYMIDFGLSYRVVDDSGKHIPYKENVAISGTARWISINAHMEVE